MILGLDSSSTPGIGEALDPWLSSLPPELAFQVMTVRYITVATWTVFFWEILINIGNDCNLLFDRRLRYPTVVYFISRLCGLGYTTSTSLMARYSATFSSSLCVMFERLEAVFFSATVIFTSLLFFFRTRAIFSTYPWVVAFFAGLWLAVLGGNLAFIANIAEPMPGNPPFCIKPGINKLVAVSTIIPLINDSLVFLAISWRLSRNSYDPCSPESGVRFSNFIFGDYLPTFSKALLLDGQAYYLTIVTMNVVSVIMIYYYSIPDILRTVFTVPNVILMNVMATRVFRNTILFNATRDTEFSTIQFHDI